MCITGDLKHDSYSVQKFEQIVDRHFTAKNINMDNTVYFTDQCPGQYKSKLPFHFLSKHKRR